MIRSSSLRRTPSGEPFSSRRQSASSRRSPSEQRDSDLRRVFQRDISGKWASTSSVSDSVPCLLFAFLDEERQWKTTITDGERVIETSGIHDLIRQETLLEQSLDTDALKTLLRKLLEKVGSLRVVFRLEGEKQVCKIRQNRESEELELFLSNEYGAWDSISTDSDLLSFLLEDTRFLVISPKRKIRGILALRDGPLETRNFLRVQHLPFQ